jgi:hypothetical protein
VASISRFDAGQAREAARALSRDGVVAFDRLFDPAVIASLAAEVRRIVPGAYDQAARQPGDYLNVGTNRINGLVPIGRQMGAALDLLQHPALETLFDETLGEDWVYESFGVISSFPGATLQRLHADDSHLFEGSDLDGKLPAYALTISIPLVTVNEVNGGTEFLLGTHRMPDKASFPGEAVTSSLQPGDCMIWDFMIRHRGQANNSAHARPMLYVTACRPFWTDSTNFRADAQKLLIDSSLVWSMPREKRKRFMRFKPTPGLRTGLGTVSRALRWYCPGLHQGLMKLLRRQ